MRNFILLLFVAVLVFSSGCYSSSNTQGGQNQGDTASQQASNTVTIEGFAFNPSTLNVKAGTTVTWVNKDSTAHTIKSDSFNSGSLNKDQSYEFKFDGKGTYEYSCGIHPMMKGKIIVE
jgi:plastocyanin